MKKLSLLAFTLVAGWSFLGHAQSQDANRKIIVELCGQNFDANKTGSGVVVGDWTKKDTQRCIQVRCDEKQDEGNSSSVIRTKCISESEYQKVIMGVVNGTPAGANNGSGGTPSGSNNGSGGTPAGANNGSGGTPSGSNNGSGGNPSGSGAGGDILYCTTTMGNIEIHPGGQCYDACKPRRSFLGIIGRKKADLERKSCVECLMGMGYDFGDDIKKKAGVRVIAGAKGGPGAVTICKDANGNIVSQTVSGGCPSGSSASGGTVVIRGNTAASANGGTAASANGGVIVSGGTAANANGGAVGSVNGRVSIPSECIKNNGKIKNTKKCQAYLSGAYTISGGGRFNCASGQNAADCIGTDEYNQIMARYYNGADCVNCQASGRKQSTLSGIAEIVGAIAPPLAMFGSSYFQSRAFERSNQAWAGAAAAGFEQCRLGQQDYYNYLQTAHTNYQGYLNQNELPGLSPEQQQAMLATGQTNCNGYSLGGFAGLGGYGYGGYSNGFIAGMMGPYGAYNPYGVGGYPGVGLTSGLGGGYITGGGFGIPGGYPGVGLTSGLGGGYITGGGFGIPGGYPGVGLTSGLGGGYITGGGFGIPGGHPGVGLTSGLGGGFITGGGFGINGGINGPYYPGGYPGGWGSGVGQGSYYNTLLSNQAYGADAMMQQQGLGYNMGQMYGGGMYGGAGGFYGASGYPGNLGGGFGVQGYLNLPRF